MTQSLDAQIHEVAKRDANALALAVTTTTTTAKTLGVTSFIKCF